MRLPTRREFIGGLGAGAAAAISLRPVFEPERLLAATQGAPPDEVIRLNYNESPYGPSPKAIAAIRETADAGYSRYFGDDTYETLSNALAAFHKLKRDNIHVGAGSTEILKICDDVFLGQHAKLVVADPAYEAVIQYAANSKAVATKVPLTPDQRHDLVKLAAAVTPETGLVYICNPNNPTGTIVRRGELQQFMDRIPKSVTVLVDEAYAEFVDDPEYESALRYVREGRNVIVAKTFSKVHGLAGMRIGYAVASKDVMAKIKAFTVDYAITGMAANAALASIKDQDNVARVAKLNAVQRQTFLDEMKRANLTCAASQTNFVMVNIKRPVAPIIGEFAKRRVLVGREFATLPTFLRVTLGTDAEMKQFYPVFRQIVRG